MTQYIADFKQDATDEQINEFFATRGLTVSATLDKLGKIYLVTGSDPSLLQGSNDPMSSPIVDAFINDSENELSLLDVVYQVPRPTYPQQTFPINDPHSWWKTYVCNQVDFEQETKTIPRKGQYSSVYVLDSGIVDSHSEFAGVNIVKLYSITGEFNDLNGHGTAIASIISGRTCGVTDATIKVVKIFDPNVPLYQSSLLSAMNAIIEDYLVDVNKPGVVNMSWCIPKNEYIESKIQRMVDIGIPVICSAGNNGVPIENTTPASMASVLTVGAYNHDLEPCDFSNYQASEIAVTNGATNYGEVDGWAPGVDIWAAKVDGTFGYTGGTSMAAAVVSAVVAYNLTPSYDANGNLYPVMLEKGLPKAGNNWFRQAAFASRPLMILDPSKYSESSNRIAAILADPIYTIAPATKAIFQKGKNNSVRILKNIAAKSIKYDETLLPAGLRIEGEWILGNPTIDLSGQPGQLVNINFEITMDDDSVHVLEAALTIIAENYFDINSPETDEMLSITLNPNTCSFTVCDAFYCGWTSCQNWASKGVQCSCYLM